MVFPGRFSTGCKRCRQRKVKCDEGRPSCRRCIIYGKPCPGYSDQFHFRFDKASSKQGSSSRPEKSPEESSVPGTARAQHHKTNNNRAVVRVASRPRSPSITPQPEVSYDDVSLCYFVRRFVTPNDDDSLPGHLSFLPSLFNHSGHGVLELATLSVAQMAAYNQFRGDKFRLQSYQNYGRALQALRKTIQTEEEVTDDRVLAAVLLLCMFKDIGEESWGDPSEHVSGLYYLLEKRGIEQLCTSRGFELFLLALLRLQVYTFLHQDNKYSDPGGLVALLGLLDPMMRAMSLMTKTLCLRHNLLEYASRFEKDQGLGGLSPSGSQEGPEEADQSTLRACFEALEEFDSWDIEAEPYWKNIFAGRIMPAALGELATRGTYYDPKTACIIILVRAARLILLLSILEYYDVINMSCGETETWRLGDKTAWANCIPVLETTIRLAIDDMLYCVPFAMGDRGPDGGPVSGPQDGAAALVVLQPIRLVTYCAYATTEQRRASQDILNRMKSAIGIRAAMSWEQQAAMGSSAPQRRGTQSLVRAMGMLAMRESASVSPSSH
ncbi:hypothetical protein F5B22DRAFT_653490 [Xylaria bambusicola]|uniref:uncharacterized protein n=1 Tax=Xylaria bambusicola TaxID=326684 RepID=UPI0020079770|nr:uncharacterized protein F5B22DRAFT_653490 [Xylaria bambusicola]KAI0521078.1 hypothetical protein F5B22DRAFT_653490 [Xylaria bambusicola]